MSEVRPEFVALAADIVAMGPEAIDAAARAAADDPILAAGLYAGVRRLATMRQPAGGVAGLGFFKNIGRALSSFGKSVASVVGKAAPVASAFLGSVGGAGPNVTAAAAQAAAAAPVSAGGSAPGGSTLVNVDLSGIADLVGSVVGAIRSGGITAAGVVNAGRALAGKPPAAPARLAPVGPPRPDRPAAAGSRAALPSWVLPVAGVAAVALLAGRARG